MKKALIIARMTLLITIRKGTLPAIALVTAVLSTVAFHIARSDGKLINELEIRINYGYGLTYSLLSLMIIALSCFTVRSQIDGKNLHLVTSMPLERKWIFAGQAIALFVICIVAEVILLATVFTNSWLYSRGFDQGEKNLAYEKYFQSRREVKPFYLSKRQVALNYAEKQEINVADLDGTKWFELYHDALREETLINKGQSRVWKFDLNDVPVEGEFVYLVYKFQRGKKRAPVQGIFELTSPGYNIYFKKKIEAQQYAEGRLEIPIDYIPDNGRFEVKFTNESEGSVVVGRGGITFSYLKGSLFENINKCFLTQVFHLSVSSLVGLCAGIGLTFSVATFMVFMLYIVSAGQPVFQLVLKDYEFLAVQTTMDTFLNNIMHTAIWLTKGLQPPELVGNISAGVNIEWSYILAEWLPAVAIYGLIASVLGALMLTSKELDKIQT